MDQIGAQSKLVFYKSKNAPFCIFKKVSVFFRKHLNFLVLIVKQSALKFLSIIQQNGKHHNSTKIPQKLFLFIM